MDTRTLNRLSTDDAHSKSRCFSNLVNKCAKSNPTLSIRLLLSSQLSIEGHICEFTDEFEAVVKMFERSKSDNMEKCSQNPIYEITDTFESNEQVCIVPSREHVEFNASHSYEICVTLPPLKKKKMMYAFGGQYMYTYRLKIHHRNLVDRFYRLL